MQYRCLVFVLLFAASITISAQNSVQSIYHKAKINITGRNINDLSSAGIETDHGIFIKNRSFISDFSEGELQIIKDLGFEFDIVIHDVTSFYSNKERQSEMTHPQLEQRSKCFGLPVPEYNYNTPQQYKSGTMGGYFTHQEMLDIIDTMTARYPKIISKRNQIEGYKTIDGNQIQFIKVSDNVIKDENEEPDVLYTALHHAREPNSLSQMIFYLWYLLENYGKDPIVNRIVDNTEMYFIPCVNPDGYLLNQANFPAGGGLWRKNTWRDQSGSIKGVDLNRNYGFSWGKDNIGSSSNPNSLTFRGLAAFSEPETQAIRKFCIDHNFKIALNYHTFGNFLIHPSTSGMTPNVQVNQFKSIGKVINKENNFSLGTGLETVGYTVNGDSDEWMYEVDAEKNSILALTPEVGPSFWPPAVDIDYLNKSCVWMNLSTALLTLSYYEAEETSQSIYLNPINKSISIRVSRAGLMDGEASVNLKSITQGVTVLKAERTVSLEAGIETIIFFDLDIEQSLTYAEGIKLELAVINGGITSKKVIEKQWVGKLFSNIFSDEIRSKDLFTSDGWDLTSDQYYSSPVSITDSPNGLYLPSYKANITLKDPIDLSNISHALLHFKAKWNIEDNYDYVQVMASKDNRDFIPLCGKYTNPGSEFQSFTSPLYDGIMSEWINEEIDLSLFIGSPKVWIRFSIFTDEYEQRDGFYFDDIEIKAVTTTSSITDELKSEAYVFPTLLTGINNLNIRGLSSSNHASFQIYDAFGKQVMSTKIAIPTISLDTTTLPNGLYFYRIYDKNVIKGHGKLTIINP